MQIFDLQAQSKQQQINSDDDVWKYVIYTGETKNGSKGKHVRTEEEAATFLELIHKTITNAVALENWHHPLFILMNQ